MTFLILLLVLAALMVVATIRLSLHDGPGAERPPVSHHHDPRFSPPAWR